MKCPLSVLNAPKMAEVIKRIVEDDSYEIDGTKLILFELINCEL